MAGLLLAVVVLPPVLLVISEYPRLFPWYEGGIRLAMNIAGAAIVLAVVFGAPAIGAIRSRRGRSGDGVNTAESREVDENQAISVISPTLGERRRREEHFRNEAISDSLYKIQTRRTQ